jgi:hypothetical protein
MNPTHSFFEGKSCVIVTDHAKEQAILPILQGVQGLNLTVVSNVKTDSLGTFSGEIERTNPPLETALQKANLALNFAKADFAFSSEGSFGPHPAMFFVPADQEWLVLKDLKSDKHWAVHHISTSTNFASLCPENWEAAVDFLKKIEFPSHGIIIKVKDKVTSSIKLIIKDIDKFSEIKDLFNTHQNQNEDSIILETDMRAHRNPTRMKVIAEAAEKLKLKLNSLCPSCYFPGFDVAEIEPGLPCAWCHTPTRLTFKSLYACQNCHHSIWQTFPNGITEADPGYCDHCNP